MEAKLHGKLWFDILKILLGSTLVAIAFRYFTFPNSIVSGGVTGTIDAAGAFLSGAFTTAIPGIILHIVLIPLIVMALQRALPWLRNTK